MPTIDKVLTLEISVERFLDACSPLELQELELLISLPRYQAKILLRSGSVPRMKNPPLPHKKPG